MADGLNFGILDPSVIRQRPNALAGLNDAANNYANMLAKKQQMDQAKQEYAFNQLKMQDYQKTRADEEATNAIYAGAVDPATGTIDYSKLNAGMASGGFGTKIPEINKQQQAQALAALQAKELKTKIYSSQQDFEDKAIRGLADNSSDENIKAFAQDSVIHGFHTPEEAQAVADKLMSIPLDQRKAIFSRRGAAAEASPKPSDLATLQNEMNALAPNDPRRAAYADAITKATSTTDAAIQEYNLAKSQGYTGSILDYKREIAKAGRTPAQAPNAPAPTMTTVIDPTNPSRSLQVDARLYKGGGLGSPGVIGTGIKEPTVGVNLSAKTIQQREAKFPQATTALKGHLTDTDNLVKDLTELSNMPGLDEITGFTGGRLPGLTAAGRAAKAKYDKIVAKGGFNELQKMRDNSVSGGALGNVSDTEGKRLEASFAGLDRRQSADDVRKAAKAAINQLNTSKANLQDAYDLTYEYKGATPTQASPAKNAIIDTSAIDSELARRGHN